MGVFLYSNKKLETSKISDVFKTRGHKDIVDHNEKDITLVTAPKIIVKNTNFLSGSQLGGASSDFAVGIGTFFYKSSYGEEALKKVYIDLDVVLKDNPVYGHWAFCIRKGNTTYVFNDMTGFMRLYYTCDGDKVVVSSSQLAVISTVANPTFDKVRLAAALTGAYGKAFPVVSGVEVFDPYRILVVEDSKQPKWVKKEIPEVPRVETFEAAIPYVEKLFNNQMKVVKEAIGDRTVYTNATGGLDSRLIACNLRKAGINFEYLNYPIYGPDSEIAEILSKGINKKLHTQTDIPCGQDYQDHYGEYDNICNLLRQYPNPRWKLVHDFEFSGARGECIDLPDIYADEDLSYMEDPRPRVLIGHLMNSPKMSKKMNAVVADFLSEYVHERLGFAPSQVLSEMQQAELSQFMGGQFGDALYNSAAQAHEYFYSLYNEWHFNHFIHNIAFEAKQGRKLTLALITKIDPELGSFPFVSRLNTRRNSVNEVHELPMQYRVHSPLKKYVPIWVKNLLYNYLSVRKATLDDGICEQIDFDLYKDVIKSNFIKRNKNFFSDTIKRLYSVDVIRKKMNISM